MICYGSHLPLKINFPFCIVLINKESSLNAFKTTIEQVISIWTVKMITELLDMS